MQVASTEAGRGYAMQAIGNSYPVQMAGPLRARAARPEPILLCCRRRFVGLPGPILATGGPVVHDRCVVQRKEYLVSVDL